MLILLNNIEKYNTYFKGTVTFPNMHRLDKLIRCFYIHNYFCLQKKGELYNLTKKEMVFIDSMEAQHALYINPKDIQTMPDSMDEIFYVNNIKDNSIIFGLIYKNSKLFLKNNESQDYSMLLFSIDKYIRYVYNFMHSVGTLNDGIFFTRKIFQTGSFYDSKDILKDLERFIFLQLCYSR